MFDFNSNKSKLNLNAPSYIPKNNKFIELMPQIPFNNNISSNPFGFFDINQFSRFNLSVPSISSSPNPINTFVNISQNFQQVQPSVPLFNTQFSEISNSKEKEIFEIASKNFFN
jgi:hypothetical protein